MSKIDSDLLYRYWSGECNPQEKVRVELWLSSEQGLPLADETMFNGSSREQIESDLRERMNASIGYAKKPSIPAFSIWPLRMVSIAAASIFCILGIFIFGLPRWHSDGNKSITRISAVSTQKGQRKKLQFGDGSVVELNSESAIRYPTSFQGQTRQVTLIAGEAFFSIAKDSAHPFKVHVGNAVIEVLGTRFNVRHNTAQKQLGVILIEGSVRFKTGAGRADVLRPGEQLHYDINTERTVVSQAVDPTYATDWRNNVLRFNDTALKEVLEGLENRYGVTFYVDKKLWMQLPVTATFKNEPLSRILSLLEKITDLTFLQKGNVVEVSRRKQKH